MRCLPLPRASSLRPFGICPVSPRVRTPHLLHILRSNMSSTAAGEVPAAADHVKSSAPASPQLPPLSPADFRAFNLLADRMDAFHNHFRQTWNLIYNAASGGKRPQGMTIRSFINVGLQLVAHLETHHSIEEAYIFPHLAIRMPEFRTGKERNLPSLPNTTAADKGKRKSAELLQQHKEIHAGMDGLQDYLRKCLSGETDFEMAALKEQLDTWGDVLWKHLDQEVKTLGAENMRKYWTLDELHQIPF
ncbi:hypothetical protein GGR57DRAFT_445851 [Xylariaceae sp. FL1272]|nr:hypothetical protein GGR57DRAFT_445851 [Xylariaceae sp. FL1272]